MYSSGAAADTWWRVVAYNLCAAFTDNWYENVLFSPIGPTTGSQVEAQ